MTSSGSALEPGLSSVHWGGPALLSNLGDAAALTVGSCQPVLVGALAFPSQLRVQRSQGQSLCKAFRLGTHVRSPPAPLRNSSTQQRVIECIFWFR